ncbi:thioesterase II family protein [Streptomyces sp. NPDC054844]
MTGPTTARERAMRPEGPRKWLAGGVGRYAPDAGVRLFCFAHAGGGTALFRPWRTALAPEIDVCPVLLPGRESRLHELPYRRVEQLIDPLCEVVAAHADRPYAFFGHSMGSVLAYEVARRFADGPFGGPLALVVSGRRAPHLASRRRTFSMLPDDAFLAELKALNGTPVDVLGQPQLLAAFLPALRADFELNELYRPLPGPRLLSPVIAYMGADDPEVDCAELAGWHETTRGGFVLRVLPGDHFYLKDGRPDVIGHVRDDLTRAAARS